MRTDTMLSNTDTDVFMVGCLLYEIWTHQQPWSGVSSKEARRLVLEGKRIPLDAALPDEIRRMINACWDPNPLERLNMEQELHRMSTVGAC